MKNKTLLHKEMERFPEARVITNHQQQQKRVFSELAMFSGTEIAKLSGEGEKVATQIFHFQQTVAAWLISYKKTCSTHLVNIYSHK